MIDHSLDFLKLSFGAVWLLYLPGVLLAYLFTIPKSTDFVMHVALRLGLGIAFWPIFLLWSSFLTDCNVLKKWTMQSGRLVVIIVGLAAFASMAFSLYIGRDSFFRRAKGPPNLKRSLAETFLSLLQTISPRHQRIDQCIFSILILLALQTRWQQIAHLVLPNWVDSIHHTMIARLLIENGTVPATYAPFLNEASFVYHWGYHALIAWMAWFMGSYDSFQIATLILYFGQILNLLSLPMLYMAGKLAFGSRRAALWSAIFGTFISWYPAYYVSWGRYPHLTGLLLLAPLLLTLWKLDNRRNRLVSWRMAAIVLLSGIILIHVRITFFLITLLAIQMLWLMFQCRWRTLREWVLVGLCAIVLTSPWLFVLLQHAKLPQLLVASVNSTAPQLNAPFPWTLFWVPGIAGLMSLATFGISGWLGLGNLSQSLRIASVIFSLSLVILIFVYQKRKNDLFSFFPGKASLLLLFWSGLLLSFFQLRKFGLPQPGFINQDSLAITFFAPISLLAAGVVNWWVGAITPKPLLKWITVLLVATCSIWGAMQMQSIVNSGTILADSNDLKALHWINETLPVDAKFAITVKPWIGATYVGDDGGYWISTLTDRMTIMPSAIYTIVMPRLEIQNTNTFLKRWAEITSLNDRVTFDFLHSNGVTHIYLGSKSVSPLRQSLRTSPFVDLIYDRDSVLIFALHPEN